MSTFSFDTVWPADSVEFCPHPAAQNIFVCGTYNLQDPQNPPPQPDDSGDPVDPPTEPRKQHRQGKCLLFEVTSDSEEPFSLLQETLLPAVLDMKWCHRTSNVSPVLGVADSEGNITLHEYRSEQKKLEQVQRIQCADSSILCLSLDWSNRRTPTTGLGSLIVSLSNGTLALLRPQSDGGLALTDTWAAHDYEPWIAAWDYWDDNVVYSGGDDLKMKGWDIRAGFSSPTFVNKRFSAGVTTIQSHPYVEHLLAVGSYDNTVRLFDSRKPLTALTEADVGGGAWRVKWHPSPARKRDLLVACMHDGFKVVRFDLSALGFDADAVTMNTGAQWEITKRFDAHESLAYGVDWSFADIDAGTDDSMIASCSFYDHKLRVWRG